MRNSLICVYFMEAREAETEERRREIIQEFLSEFWKETPALKKRLRKIELKIPDDFQDEHIAFWWKHNSISFYECRLMHTEDDSAVFLRTYINRIYARYCSPEFFYHKEYYTFVRKFREIFEKYKRNPSEKLFEEAAAIIEKAEEMQKDSIAQKMNISFDEFKVIVNHWFERCFANYLYPHEVEQRRGASEDSIFDHLGDEGLVVSYICKAVARGAKRYRDNYLTGQYIICPLCGKQVKKHLRANRKIYCDDCAEARKKEQSRLRNAKKRAKNVTQSKSAAT